MKNVLKLDHEHQLLVMDRTFAKKSENTMSNEYRHLQDVRAAYPDYTVIRREIKKNPNKECWRGLTYAYMENYISTHEEGAELVKVLTEFSELRLISQCHSAAHRYPVIKRWFLSKYPEIANLGMPATEEVQEKADLTLVEKDCLAS